jgi:hypothetical protein
VPVLTSPEEIRNMIDNQPQQSNPMLAKIQAMLNKADGTDNPAEREAYLEKAEQMMQKYSIDAAMLSEAKKLAGGKPETPEQRGITFMPADDKLGNQWYNLIIAVAKHYDCDFLGWTNGSGFLVGFPSNMDLTEMVYTSLRLQALQKLDPKPNKDLEFDENVYILHEAGIKWRSIAHLMNQAYYEAKELGIVIDSKWEVVPWEVDADGKGKKDGGRLIRACKRWCKLVDVPYRAVSSPVTFQRSYAQGFLNEVRDRFARLQKYKQDQIRSTSGAELVLFDRNKLVKDAMDELKKLLGHKDGKSYRQTIHGEAYDRGRRDGATADLGQDRMGSSGRKQLS